MWKYMTAQVAFVAEGADTASRGNPDATAWGHHVEPEQS